MNDTKQTLRSYHRRVRASLTEETRHETDRAITARILSTEEYAAADCILLYAAVRGEVDLSAVAREALCDGKIVAYPRVAGDGEMHFHAVRSLLDLSPDAYGIPAPRAGARIVAPNLHTLMLVPAVALDHAGYRLGQGGGYYDRYLATHLCIRAGIVREVSFTDTLPHDVHDQTMDIIITEKQIYKVK